MSSNSMGSSGTNSEVAMYDFEIKALSGGEVGVSALTEHAQRSRRLKAGHTQVFKTRHEAAPYVAVAEAEGFTFAGKELLRSRR